MIPVVAMIVPTGCADSGISRGELNADFYPSLAQEDSLTGAAALKEVTTIPILKVPSFEAKWGAPSVRVSRSGNYELNYANPDQPFDRVAVHASEKPFPTFKTVPKVNGERMVNDELTAVKVPQKFRTVVIEGKTVKWFQEALSGGADGAYYMTEGFSLTDASGKTGYYRLVVESGDNADVLVSRRFSAARLGK